MPLQKGKSKQAFEHNMKVEMKNGKPQDQALAIAYSMKRRKKMAKGGPVSAADEKRPMPETKANDAAMVSRNEGRKPLVMSGVLDNPPIPLPKTQPIKHPRHVPITGASLRLRNQEDDLIESARVNNGPQEQPSKAYDEEGPDRHGPQVSDMQDEHSTRRKPYAKGGEVEPGDYRASPNKYEDDLLDLSPSEDEGEQNAHSHDEMDPDRQGLEVPDMEREHSNGRKPYASGGSVKSGSSTMDYSDGGEISPEDEIDDEDHASIAAAIMAKRKKYAMGGEINGEDSIYTSDDEQSDLARNAEEDANMEDRSSYDALRKENYSESAGLRQLDQPEDSNEHGDSREDAESDKHDKIDRMRSRIKR